MGKLIKVLYLFLLLIFIDNCYSTNIANKYIKQANDTELYKNKEWLSLVHYKKNIFNKYKSIVYGDNFFISKNGKTDPQSELIETIVNLFKINTKEEENILCKFPARVDFLKKHLKIQDDELIKINCIEYNKFFNEVKPESLSIIFPTAYINNPASMFGHTLIRINKINSNNYNSQLNSIGVNYGANTGQEISGISFAFKGVFGLYNGFFSATPYYKMVNNYNNLESRDIWEYQLNYNKQEAEYYTKHMWELLHSESKYYFFKKNCSYYILESLNILRPELDLTNNFYFYTAPVDTIKILINNKIITEKKYRAGLQKQIKNISKEMNYLEKKSSKNIIINKQPLIENAKVYEASYKLLQYNKIKNKITLSEYRKKSMFILKKINTFEKYELKESYLDSPDAGHKLNKINLQYGYSNIKKDFIELSYKPAYHELLDNNKGFEFGSEINFFSTILRYYNNNNKLDLEKFNFVSIKSLAPWDYFFKPISFSVLFGINNLYDDYKTLVLETNGGITIGNEKFSLFFLVGPSGNYNRHFNNDFNIGFNTLSGMLFNFKYFKTTLNLKTNNYIKNDYNYLQLNIGTSLFISNNIDLIINYDKYNYRKYNNESIFSFGLKIIF